MPMVRGATKIHKSKLTKWKLIRKLLLDSVLFARDGNRFSTCGRRCLLRFTLAGIALANTRCFAAQLAQVIKLGPAHVTLLHDVDMIDDRRVQRKNSLNPDAKTDFAHGDRLAHAAMFSGDDHAFKGLQTLFGFGFLDAHVNPDRVAGLKFGKVIT